MIPACPRAVEALSPLVMGADRGGDGFGDGVWRREVWMQRRDNAFII